ncbi:NAD-dependent epimerase [uncultured Prochlorococcus sp.]|uniref:NAD-dependent epimerase n=1 Tax=uncultured Prochlorococcus sp. TaxID=159733 RepID=UPI00258E76A3|nr:NAD-dependent epimerase [uncultured Prochlorococcus sp.]
MTILITGSSGFIGYHLSRRLLQNGEIVIGVDNMNNYYDKKLKEKRLEELKKISTKSNFIFKNLSIEDNKNLSILFQEYQPSIVVNLAAQAGVRYSIENPSAYIQSNIVGFNNILENCRRNKIEHLIYASSSSVYGGNEKMPFSETDSVDHPVSLYAASKKSNELMAHSYSHLYDLPSTGLRFFTVYGPWGRPDMALFLFTDAIINDRPIKVFNNGNMIRDFTYIDDIIEGLYRVIYKKAKPNKNFDKTNPNPSNSWAPYRVFNIGNSNPINLRKYISSIEEILDKKAIKQFLPMQPGDVVSTSADTTLLENWIGFKPETDIKKGIQEFVKWYKMYYKIT